MPRSNRDEPIVISDSETASESERLPPASHPATRPGPSASASASASAPTSSGSVTPSLASLIPDRAQLERERRERIRRRRRDEGRNSSSTDSDEEPTLPRPAPAQRRRLNPPSQASSSSAKPSIPTLASSSIPSSRRKAATDPITADDRFWQGTVKHSYNRYAAPGKQGCPLASFLLPSTPTKPNGLKHVVMATYALEIRWLYSLFPRGINVTLILHEPMDQPASVLCPGWDICEPRRSRNGGNKHQWNTQHMKFLILIYDDFVRVAILSGNLYSPDWERIENTAFIQDFQFSASTSAQPENDFRDQLERVLQNLLMPQSHAVFQALRRTDFSQAKASIVATWPEQAVLTGWDAIESQGLGRLGKVVRSLGIGGKRGDSLAVEAQGSSLANLDRKWMEHFHILASGLDPRGLLPLSGKQNEEHSAYFTATGRKPTFNEQDDFDSRGFPPVKILFPSHRWVENNSVEGPIGALSFFGKAKDFEKSPIKHVYHQPKSRRGDIMMHAKSLLAYMPSKKEFLARAFNSTGRGGRTLSSASEEGKDKPIGWTYLGSSNFTRAAHGVISGKVNAPTMSTRNWELGVVLPIHAADIEEHGADADCLRAVTYTRPTTRYARDDVPWDNGLN